MRVARVLGAVGRTLIWSGTIILLFVAYQLWGTGIHERQAQNRLEGDFAALLEEAGITDGAADDPVVTASTEPETSVPDASVPDTTTTTGVPAPPPPADGQSIAHLVIPKIGVDKFIVEGVQLSNLKLGPGHYPETPMPGQPGNAAIAGHRTTYGAPFYDIDQLQPADEILITTLQGTFRYEVLWQKIVRPNDISVLDVVTDPATGAPLDTLTLTACHPRYSARQRIVIQARLVVPPAPASTTTTTPGKAEAEPPKLDVSPPKPSVVPAVLWGLGVVSVWLAFYVLSRRWRRWPAYLLGTPVFLVVLFFFFDNFARFLPPDF